MNERLIILGTGNAAVTRCYNTCFAIQQGEDYFLVDADGGNGILTQLERSDISLTQIHEVFISHGHTDHLLGLIWLIRMIIAAIKSGHYQGRLTIYCHAELKKTALTIVKLMLPEKFVKLIGDRVVFKVVKDGQSKKILGNKVTFFDIQSDKAKQFGFAMTLSSGRRLTFLGDEPYQEHEYPYAFGTDWLLHEAFCLYAERERFKPYEKAHTTVKDACVIGARLAVANLLLYHTEDRNLAQRKALYTAEGAPFFDGNLLVPDDLEAFDL